METNIHNFKFYETNIIISYVYKVLSHVHRKKRNFNRKTTLNIFVVQQKISVK